MSLIGDLVQRILQPTPQEKPAQVLITKADASANELGAYQFYGYPFMNTKRKQGSGIDFDTLRTFSVTYDVVRACINFRKRQISNLDWSIVPVDEKANTKKLEKRAEEIRSFFLEPAHNTDFTAFVDKIIEDLLVIDGVVLWKDKTYGGDLKELLNVDSATIRMKIAEDGTLPEPPETAYQQIIAGELQGEYTTNEMIYKIMNPRTNTVYGLSPLESMIIGVDTAMKSQLYNSSMLSEGTVPEGFFSLPDTWTGDQIKDFQVWFDSMMSGSLSNTPRIKFMPGGKGVGYTPAKKPEDMRFIELEKWLLMKTCAMFDVQPQDIGYTENINYNNSQMQGQKSNERGLIPTASFLKRMFNEIIRKDFEETELKFEWMGLQAIDEDFELTRAEKLLRAGAMTIDELRLAQGLEPFGTEASSKPLIFTASGAVTLDSVTAEVEEEEIIPQDEKEEEDELKEMIRWERKCMNYIKDGRGLPEFETKIIDKTAQNLIKAQLSFCKSKDEVRAVFKPFKVSLQNQKIVDKAVDLRHDVAALKRTKYGELGSTE